MERMFRYTLAAALGLVPCGVAQAQSIATEDINTAVGFGYERGRNVSVLQRDRPDYQGFGIRAGGFTIFPMIDITTGYTDNTYQTSTDRKSDGFTRIIPQVSAKSNWSVHSLSLDAGGNFARYFHQTPRNENGWHLNGKGRVDVSSRAALNFGAQTVHQYESQFEGAAVTGVRDITPYQATGGSFLADVRFARLRTALSADYTTYDFKNVALLDGATFDQHNRDRKVARVGGHVEYGIRQDIGLFVEATYSNTNYDQPLAANVPNRDSNEIQVLTGFSADITDFIRGRLGVGYVKRDYQAGFQNAGGFSMQGKIEYFPTKLTTVTLTARRLIQDATTGGSGFFNTGGAIRVDHELLRNLILSAGFDYESDTYIGVAGHARVITGEGNVQYMLNRLLGVVFNGRYGKRTSEFVGVNGPELHETRLSVGLRVHR